MNSQGMSLIECLLVLSIAALLVGLGSSSFTPLLQRYQADQPVYQLYQMTRYARQYAVMHNVVVTLCPAVDETGCSEGGQYWLLFTDHNRNERLDAMDRVVRFSALVGGWHPRLRLSAGRQYLQFRPVGMANGTAGKLYTCHSERGHSGHYVTVALSGRVSLLSQRRYPVPLDCS